MASCGDDDGDDDGGSQAANKTVTDTATTSPGGTEAQIRAVYGNFVSALYKNDPPAACATMTPRLQKQFGAGMSCEKRLIEMIESQELSDEKPFIVKLKVNGDKASAKVKTKSSNVYPALFAKQDDGEWKLSGGL